MKTFLLSTFVALQAGDVMSTNRFLANGTAVEGNPLVSAMMHVMGEYWWIPKWALCIAFVALLGGRVADRRVTVPALIVLNAIYLTVVVNNLML